MRVSQIRLAALALVSGIALSGCAYDMYGDGYGYGNYGYGLSNGSDDAHPIRHHRNGKGKHSDLHQKKAITVGSAESHDEEA